MMIEVPLTVVTKATPTAVELPVSSTNVIDAGQTEVDSPVIVAADWVPFETEVTVGVLSADWAPLEGFVEDGVEVTVGLLSADWVPLEGFAESGVEVVVGVLSATSADWVSLKLFVESEDERLGGGPKTKTTPFAVDS